jgi:hypothetical protein
VQWQIACSRGSPPTEIDADPQAQCATRVMACRFFQLRRSQAFDAF